jgi:hypothetical protein
MPSGEVKFDNEQGGSLLVDDTREPQNDFTPFHPQMSPIMSEETFRDIDNAITSRIGNAEIPENEIMYLFTEPEEDALFNPPVLCFAFAAKPGLIVPEDINVKLDDADISSKIHYNYYYNAGRKANYYLGHFKPRNYLNPQNIHNLDINFSPLTGGSFNEYRNFAVPNDDRLQIVHAGVVFDKVGKIPDLRKINIEVNVPEDVEIGESLLNPAKWTLNYEDDSALPPVNLIEKNPDGSCQITLSSEAIAKRKIKLSFSPAEGINSKVFDLGLPDKPIRRGGEVARHTMSSCCTGNFGGGIPQNAQNCEKFHIMENAVNCPDSPCYGTIEEWGLKTVYSFSDDYIHQDSDDGTADLLPYLPGSVNCDDLYRLYLFDCDYEIYFDLYGFDGAGNSCGLLDEIGPVNFYSDTTIPTVEATISEETLCADPGNCTPCEKYKHYMVTVTGDDNQCLRYVPMFFYFYQNKGCYPEVEPFNLTIDVRHHPPSTDKHMERRFFIDQNSLACVDFLKIIMFDKKGNWSSTKVVSWDDPNYAKLPYPDKITLSFDDENRDSDKQYVNLDGSLITPLDQEVCVYKSENPDQGPFIYLEVAVDPPIQGITVLVEYGDPPFDMSGNEDPTNIKDLNNPDPDYSAGNNPDLTADEYYLLWGSHPAWVNGWRELGDNYNYYHKYTWSTDPNSTFVQYLNQHNVPAYDPIRKHRPEASPCFDNCNVPPGYLCTNPGCNSTVFPLTTNIYGKAAVYFNTQSHGGDNFKFKAYTMNQGKCTEPCLESGVSRTFTVWRKIYVDYAWMQARTKYPNPNCEIKGKPQHESEGIYDFDIYSDAFDYFNGVFGDSFVEIEKYYEFTNQDYYLALDGSDRNMTYSDYLKPIFEGSANKVMLVGVDHITNQCIAGYGEYGRAEQFDINDRRNFVAVGLYVDIFAYDSPEEWIYDRFIDGIMDHNPLYPIFNTASHELGHSLLRQTSESSYYGLMTPGDVDHVIIAGVEKPARRSYFHGRDIMKLRNGLQTCYYP